MGRRSNYFTGIPDGHTARLQALQQRGGTPTVHEMPPGVVCVAAQEQIWTQSALAIFGQMWRPGDSLFVERGPHSIAQKRTDAVHMLLRQPKLQWLLFLDSDMTPASDTLLQLWRTEKDIVSGLCFWRSPPFPAAAGCTTHLAKPAGWT